MRQRMGAVTALLMAACAGDSADPMASTGTLTVTVSVSGTGVDADGFFLDVNGISHRVLADDTLRVDGLPVGTRSVLLRDVATHCEALQDSVRPQIVAGAVTHVTMHAECYGALVYSEWSGPYADQLYYLDENGIRKKLTPPMGGGQWSPQWSPDGSRVLFMSITQSESDLYISDIHGGTRPLATRPGWREEDAAWSPDGLWVAYVLIEGNPFTWTDLRIVRADGSEDRSLLNDGGISLSPTWSPDGQYIAFACWRAVHGICYIQPDGTLIGQAPATLAGPQKLRWSPDGSRIALEDFTGTQRIRVLDVMSGEVTTPIPTAVTFGHAYWNRNGTSLAISSLQDGVFSAMAVNADGSNPRVIADHVRWLGDWSPDGARIAFGILPTSIHIASDDGSHTRQLYTAAIAVIGTAWRPLVATTTAAVARLPTVATIPTGPAGTQRPILLRADPSSMSVSPSSQW